MSLSASYDPKLQSVINTEYYDQNFAGLPSKKDRSNSAYTLESPYEQKDAALAQADLDAIDFVNEIMDLTAWQGGVSTAASADTSKADDAKTKIGKLLNSMKSMLSMVTAGANILSNLRSSVSGWVFELYHNEPHGLCLKKDNVGREHKRLKWPGGRSSKERK